MKCELCESETDLRSGCALCGKMICPACEAAIPAEDDTGEIVCEACA